MPKYKLIYFDMRARGEIIRLLFKVAGVEFEDFRVKTNGLIPVDEWFEMQKKTPFGQLPVLQVDGEELAQSHAIERFLAREFGLDGSTSLEKGKVDMWIEAADEIIRRVSDNVEQHDPKLKEQEKKHIQTKIAPLVLGTLAKTLTANKGGFIVGNKLTVADLAFLSLRDWLKSAYGQEGLDLLNSFKPVSDHIQKIAEIPAVAQWLKTRPESPY